MDHNNSWDCLFSQCIDDPKGSVHRAWSLTLLLTVIFFIIAIFEVVSLKDADASFSLIIAASMTAIIQLCMIGIGTFIIKRYSTTFSVGFLLGLVIVVSQQNLLLAITFWNSEYGSASQNIVFANLAFTLFLFYAVFGAVLARFRGSIMVAAIDAKGFSRRSSGNNNDSSTSEVI